MRHVTATTAPTTARLYTELRRATDAVHKSQQRFFEAARRRQQVVLALRAEGETMPAIAAELGLTKSGVQYIINRADAHDHDSHAAGTHHPDPRNNSTPRPGVRNGLRETNGSEPDPNN